MKKSYIWMSLMMLLLPVTVTAQTETTQLLLAENSKSTTQYVYGSVIRAFVNQVNTPGLQILVKEIDLVVYGNVTLETQQQVDQKITQMHHSLKAEELNDLFSAQGAESLSSILDDMGAYVRSEDGEVSQLVLFRKQKSNIEFLDISGVISYRNLSVNDIRSLYELIGSVSSGSLFSREGEES